MMKLTRHSGSALCALLGACAAEPADPAQFIASEPPAVVERVGNQVAHLDLIDGRSIHISEVAPGAVLVQQSGAFGLAPIPLGDTSSEHWLSLLIDALAPVMDDAASTAGFRENAARVEQRMHEQQQQFMVEPAPNVYDFDEDIIRKEKPLGIEDHWFEQNFCLGRTDMKCVVGRTGKSGAGVLSGHLAKEWSVSDWQCTVLNAHDTENANADFFAEQCTANGVSCGGWALRNDNGPLPPRTWRAASVAGYNPDIHKLYCLVNGAHWSLGMIYNRIFTPKAEPKPKPPTTTVKPSQCGYWVRAHTKNCKNLNGTKSTIISMCADACAPDKGLAEGEAKQNLSKSVCVGGGPGCCEVDFNDDFNRCGYK